MILIFKLIAAPLLILCATLLSRRYGPTVGGLFLGVPLVTGPISVFTALENGSAFAQHAAIANLVGQTSTCMFCLCYAISAKWLNCWFSMMASVGAFFLATLIWNQFDWTFAPALALLLCTIALMGILLKPGNADAAARIAPRFDLPMRMIISACFVLVMTLLSKRLGPQLSGLLAPFPTFVLILAVFTHHQMGGAAAANLTRGVIVGSFAFAAFFVVVFAGVVSFSITATYLAAAVASISTSGLIYLARHQIRRRAAHPRPSS